MGDHFREYLEDISNELKRLPEKDKKRIILTFGATMFFMGVFFYAPPQKAILAKNAGPKRLISLSELEPEKRLGDFVYEDRDKKSLPAVRADSSLLGKIKNSSPEEIRIAAMVAGHPMEEMTPHIAKRKKEVASFLVAIAKKESNWGKHSPKKAGRDCYNYWGYKGGYNLTESGYSCFDNPEQAIEVVGNRIEDLLGKKIDTPERFVVWKCGSTCEGHDPAGVKKWISDVALYYGKLNS